MKQRLLASLCLCGGCVLLGFVQSGQAQADPVEAMLDKLVPREGLSVLLATEPVESHFRKKFKLKALPANIDLTKETVVEMHFVNGCFNNGSYFYRIEELDHRWSYEANGKLVDHDLSKTPTPQKQALGKLWTAMMKVEKFGTQPTAQAYHRSVGPPNIIIITHHPKSPRSNRMLFCIGSPPILDSWTRMILAIMEASAESTAK